MRTHKHEVGEQGNFWTLDLGVSNYISPTYEDMKALWEATLEDCRPWGCRAKLLMIEVVYSIVSLHQEKKGEDKKGVRLAQWHIHTLIYVDGFSPKTIAQALRGSWLKVANEREDWKEKIKEGRKKDGTWRQGCHCDVATEQYQKDGHCYNRGKVAYMMWQAIHQKTYCWENHEPAERPFAEMLRRLKLATEEDILRRAQGKRNKIMSYWIEWAKNVKVALANIPSDNNPYHMADRFGRILYDVANHDSTYIELQAKISKIPDIRTPAQWRKVYDKLVRNLETAGVQGLIADGYEAIKEELKDTMPLLGVSSVEGVIEVYRDGDGIRWEVRPGKLDEKARKEFEGIPEGVTITPWKPDNQSA